MLNVMARQGRREFHHGACIFPLILAFPPLKIYRELVEWHTSLGDMDFKAFFVQSSSETRFRAGRLAQDKLGDIATCC
jgi:hypothetical protein